jgi:hypothetical protein
MPSSNPLVNLSPSKTGTVKPPTLDIRLRVGQAFTSLVTRDKSLRGKWLTASCLVNIIKQRYAFRDDSDFTATVLNKATYKVNQCIDTQDYTNTTGQFRFMKSLKLDGNKFSRVMFYYITDEGKPFVGGTPCGNNAMPWKDFYDGALAAGEEHLTRLRAQEKKARKWDDIDTALLEFHSVTDNQRRQNKTVVPVYTPPTYWESTDAKTLFGAKPEETVKDALDRMCEALDKVVSQIAGYKLIMPGDGDPEDRCTDYEKKTLREKAMHLRLAYKLALEKMGSGLTTWADCCEESARTLAGAGIHIGSSRAVQLWNKQYRKEGTLVLHVGVRLLEGKKRKRKPKPPPSPCTKK